MSLQAKIAMLIEGLNPEQKKAATTVQGALLVLAGAGTGKTKVITSRIAYMIAAGVPPEDIVAVSFTNKAAREMRERLAHIVGDKLASQTCLSTFHSFALQLLRRYPKEAGLGQRFTIADEGEARSILKETLREQNLEELFALPVAVEKISMFKDKLFTAAEFDSSTSIFDKAVLKNLFLGYNRRLRLFNLVDFDDLVYLAAIMLRTSPATLDALRARHKYLMIDEFQDTSTGQFELIRLLSGEAGNVCVVGDDDQSIYSWRGARPEVVFDFLNCFPAAQRVTLEQNYRCSPTILGAANAIIAENTNRLGKTLWSRQPDKHKIHVHAAENERDEALFVADQIQRLRHQDSSLRYEDCAILIRSNSQSAAIEQVFSERNVPYSLSGGTKFFDRKEVRDLFSYLKFAHNPQELSALFRVINLPPRGVGVATLEKMKDKFAAVQTSADAPVGSAQVFDVLSSFAQSHTGVAEFLRLWEAAKGHFANASDRKGLIDALTFCYEHVGLKKDIVSSSANMQAANMRMEIAEKVFKVIDNLALPHESLEQVVDALHLDEPRFQKKEDSSGRVQMMTMHASKGLEFPVVFLVGVEETVIPHERSLDVPHGEEEERRLFYVALTRAKQRLTISHCGFRAKGRQRNRERERFPSRFLATLPENLLELSETDPAAEEAKRMDAAKKLFEMFR